MDKKNDDEWYGWRQGYDSASGCNFFSREFKVRVGSETNERVFNGGY